MSELQRGQVQAHPGAQQDTPAPLSGLRWLLSFQSFAMSGNLYQLLSKAHEQP